MTSITARVPRIDWECGFERHWNGGSPVHTHIFNMFSFLFPQAERFFIDVVREVAASVDAADNPELAHAIKGFIAQESIHCRQHEQYNKVLEQQGYKNVVHEFIVRRLALARRKLSPLTKLAIVCGYEHYTAILGNFVLSNPQLLRTALPEMALVWGWHSAEETEHKAVCFDLYKAAGGGWVRRGLVFFPVTFNFIWMIVRLYVAMLHRDGCLRPTRIVGTIGQTLHFLCGKAGVAWHLLRYGTHYLSPWFHPWDQNNRDKLHAWILGNQPMLRAVDRPDTNSLL